MSVLDVLLDGTLVAHLDDVAGAGMAALRYTPECIRAYPDGAPLLSTRLPVRPEFYPGVYTRTWLDGLLPEGDVRTVLAARAKVDPSDLVGLLRAYGRDCAGAVSVLDAPAGAGGTGPGGVRWLSEDELAAAVRNLPRAPFGVSVSGRTRVSLGGVQGKFAVVVEPDAGRIGLPEGMTASTHILKPAPLASSGAELWPGIVTAEALCMAFCRALGLDTPQTAIRHLPTGPALLVSRYDRARRPDGTVRRLHQEDLCQAAGIAVVNKYEDPASTAATPTLAGLVAVLRRFQAATLPTLREILGRITAHALVTNCDAHGKNWAFMLPGTTVRLAPVYDVVPSTLWPDIDTALAMRVGGCGHIEQLHAGYLLDEAARWGLGRRAAMAVLERIKANAPGALEQAEQVVVAGGGDAAIVEQVARIVRDQHATLFRPPVEVVAGTATRSEP